MLCKSQNFEILEFTHYGIIIGKTVGHQHYNKTLQLTRFMTIIHDQ